MRKATCPMCGKTHDVDDETYAMFGTDTFCMPCVDRDHLRFMQKNAKALGLTCTPGCICGFGKENDDETMELLPECVSG